MDSDSILTTSQPPSLFRTPHSEIRIKIGVMERVLGQPRSRMFAAAAELGFEGLEAEVQGDLDLLAASAKEAGVALCTVICDGPGFGHRDPEVRASARARLIHAIADAEALGAEMVLLPQFDLRDLNDGAAAARFVNDMKECLPRLDNTGITLGWENALSAEDTLRMLDRVGSPAFRCYFDSGNSAKRGRDPAAELRTLGNAFCRVHAKNLEKRSLDEPGVDLNAWLLVLAEQGYAGWLILETGPGSSPLETAAHNRAVLVQAWEQLTKSGR